VEEPCERALESHHTEVGALEGVNCGPDSQALAEVAAAWRRAELAIQTTPTTDKERKYGENTRSVLGTLGSCR